MGRREAATIAARPADRPPCPQPDSAMQQRGARAAGRAAAEQLGAGDNQLSPMI